MEEKGGKGSEKGGEGRERGKGREKGVPSLPYVANTTLVIT